MLTKQKTAGLFRTTFLDDSPPSVDDPVARGYTGVPVTHASRTMTDDHFETFDDFWPYYLAEHADPTNRALHVAGTLTAVATAGYAAATRKPKLLALAPAIGYGAAWIGHFFIEKNKPATFKHPLWSLIGDFKMAGMTVTGRIDDELRRYGIEGDDYPALAAE
jgi:hypothetical protein